MKSDYRIDGTVYEFKNHADECVGTGRMGLALQREYFEQLKQVQADIGFKYIRGHGLFHDDMAIYQEYTDKDGVTHVEYNFTYLDMVMDSYMEVNIRPFLELGFMPKKLSTGDNSIFYWQGHTTPPKSYEAWCTLVTETLEHLMERYGKDEVVTWPIEVWNEPNLPGFWENADMDEYMVLFENTFRAIKKLDPRFRVGGPAICGVEDEKHMKHFMDFISEKGLKVDFITRHHYTSEPPQLVGHYSYIQLVELNESLKSVENSRRIIDSYPDYKGIDMHITEFNTAYVPNAVIHDTNQNAAYIASLLCRLGETSESYSYWTFGDIFEEMGVPVAPFYGGFGMMANRGIKKPTYYTFEFMKKLSGECILKSDNSVVTKQEDGSVRGIAFNSNIDRTGEVLELSYTIDMPQGEYMLMTKTVDESTCNPLKVWHDMGEPTHLSPTQEALLRESDRPFVSTSSLCAADGQVKFDLTVNEFGLVYFEILPKTFGKELGFDYDRCMAL